MRILGVLYLVLSFLFILVIPVGVWKHLIIVIWLLISTWRFYCGIFIHNLSLLVLPSHFLLHSFILLSYSFTPTKPHSTFMYSTPPFLKTLTVLFLASWPVLILTPISIHTNKNEKLGSMCKQEHIIIVSVYMSFAGSLIKHGFMPSDPICTVWVMHCGFPGSLFTYCCCLGVIIRKAPFTCNNTTGLESTFYFY